MKKIFEFVINSRIIMTVIQIALAYLGWSMTAVTIVNSSLNSLGLVFIITAIFLKDIVHGIFWLYNYLGFNLE